MIYLYTFLDLLAAGIVLFSGYYTLKHYRSLPEVIPTHFDPTNEPDAYGNKKWIFFYPILGLLVFCGFMFIVQDPEGFNYPVEITETNKDRQFTIALLAMRLLLIVVLLIFLNLLDYSRRKALDSEAKPVATFATVILTVLLTSGIAIAIASILK